MEQDEKQRNSDISEEDNLKEPQKKISSRWPALLVIAAFLLGISGGYVAWGRPQQIDNTARSGQPSQDNNVAFDIVSLAEQVNPTDGYDLGVSYGDLGPQVLAAGGIDYSAFAALYESSGRPLTEEQIKILTEGTDKAIVINAENAHFLLNFFWAVGLVNANPILTEGPITQNSGGQIDRFASTGGWTLGTKPVMELFASYNLISLTPEQQARVEEAASLIYRPCCNNPTLFPDCNHGMAMLGLLELMASQGTTLDEMLQAAKYVNAFWFPQQALETAIFLEATQLTDFRNVDPALVVGKEMYSGSGFATVHQYLQTNGLLAQMPGSGSSCAN
jgi:hypothetical protein